MPRRLLTALVFGLPILGTAFVVVMGGYLLVAAMGDVMAARVLQWIGATLLMLIVGDALLLVALLGVFWLSYGEKDDQDEP